jgi:hypothetical protein
MAMNRTEKTRRMGRTLTNLQSASLFGTMVLAVTLAGCTESNTTTGTKPVAPSAGAESSPAAGKPGKAKLDTTSRRQHQKQLAGQAAESK